MSAKFDIPGRVFDFQKDLAYGQNGEMLIDGFMEALSGGSVEVKNDRYRNGTMVVETDQNPKGIKDDQGNPILIKSGINITTAKWLVYIFSPEGGFIIVSTSRLKRFLRANPEKYNKNTKTNLGGPDNPAKGFLVKAPDVLDLLRNADYDDVGNQ